jgi:hypothetical protein
MRRQQQGGWRRQGWQLADSVRGERAWILMPTRRERMWTAFLKIYKKKLNYLKKKKKKRQQH